MMHPLVVLLSAAQELLWGQSCVRYLSSCTRQTFCTTLTPATFTRSLMTSVQCDLLW